MSHFDTKAIANSILKKLQKNKLNANSIKLQKLIYFSHGWHLAITGTGLIAEEVQASPFGIVISSIYHSCKEFGNNPITSELTEYNTESSKWEEPFVTLDETANFILDKIVEKYGHLSAIQLSNITHKKHTPWEQVTKNKNPTTNNMSIIKDDFIKDFFQKYANAQRPEGKKNLLNINIDDIKIHLQNIDNEPDEITSKEHTEYVQSSYWTSFKKGDKKWKRVREYAILWSSTKHRGIIKLTLADDVEYKIIVKSFREMDAIANIFRFEKIVYYNITSRALASGWLPLSKEQ